MTREQLKKAWDSGNGNVSPEAYLADVKTLTDSGTNFTVIMYRRKARGKCNDRLERIGSLNVFSRRRLRSPHHVSLTAQSSLSPPPSEEFRDWHWQITPEHLRSAIEFARDTGFVVTFSTFKSGASQPQNMHFQALPGEIKWNERNHQLFHSLLNSHGRLIAEKSLGKEPCWVYVLDYPVFAAKVVGSRTSVCRQLLRLSQAYDSLMSFNLIIARSGEEDEREMAGYFFPRRFDGHVMPERFRLRRMAFASWECGGVFQVSDIEPEFFHQLTFEDLREGLLEVSIQDGSIEWTTIKNLLRYP